MAPSKTLSLLVALFHISAHQKGFVSATPLMDNPGSVGVIESSDVVTVSTIIGPLLEDETLGNPSILHYQGVYYAYASHEGGNRGQFENVPTAMSTDLTQGWKKGPDALTDGVGAWTVDPQGGPKSGVWTPDVSMLHNGEFIMYYSANANSTYSAKNERCLGVAYAPKPTGPWKPFHKPLYCPRGGAIGADGIKDGKNRYLLFKDGSKVNDSNIALWPVSPKNGRPKPTTTPYIITDEHSRKKWEGPAITKMPNGSYLLLHTTGKDNLTYQIHTATSDTINGIYNEGPVLLANPITVGNTTVYRPGGPDFVGNSKTEFVFFGSPAEDKNGERRMYYGKLSYNSS